MKLGLVLGGGGLIGLGYHAGAMKALYDSGVDPANADLIVGTSAGAVIGSYLRTGWSPDDFYDYAYGRHPNSEKTEEEQKEQVHNLFVPMWANGPERIRRGIGSMFAAASSRGIWHKVGRTEPPAALRKLFPSGMYSTQNTRDRFERDLPEEWPDEKLYLCAADLYRGNRVAFGHWYAPEASLRAAVLASTAIPGVFPPVRIGDRHYVDGGVISATSLDLATDEGCDAIICIAPLGYRREDGLAFSDVKMLTPVVLRAMFARALRREVNEARAKGIDVLVVRPWLTEIRSHGSNTMKHYDRVAVVDAAREGTVRLLEENADHPALQAFKQASRKERAG